MEAAELILGGLLPSAFVAAAATTTASAASAAAALAAILGGLILIFICRIRPYSTSASAVEFGTTAATAATAAGRLAEARSSTSVPPAAMAVD